MCMSEQDILLNMWNGGLCVWLQDSHVSGDLETKVKCSGVAVVLV